MPQRPPSVHPRWVLSKCPSDGTATRDDGLCRLPKLSVQREALTLPAIVLGREALPASRRATGTRNGEHDT